MISEAKASSKIFPPAPSHLLRLQSLNRQERFKTPFAFPFHGSESWERSED